MHIRSEIPGDVRAVEHIEYAAFLHHPQHEPGAEPTEHRIVAALRDGGALALSLVAESKGRLVGHLALSPARVGDDAEGWFLLGPVGVLPEAQGRGVGSALIRAAVEDVRSRNGLGIVLVGDPVFYGRFGFAARPGLDWPGVPGTYVLALPLADRAPQGTIVAHAAFGIR